MLLLLYEYMSQSYSGEAKASNMEKQSAVLSDEVETGEYLVLSKSEGSSTNSKFDIELNDHALLDAMVNDGSNEDDLCLWENYKEQRKTFMGSGGPQGAAKHDITETVVSEPN
jgi:hypothetical protein